MATPSLLGTQTFDTNSGTHTVVATPAAGDLIVIVVANTGNTANVAPTDNNADGNGGTGGYERINTCVKNTSADTLQMWVRRAPIGSATSTTFTHAPGASSGGGLAVHKITGMARYGLAAVRQSAIQSNQALGNTPTPVYGSAALTGNPHIGAVFNATSPATMTPRASWTESADVGYSTPTTGLETAFRASGETTTSMAWGGTSASAFASITAEFDTSTWSAVDDDQMPNPPAEQRAGAAARAAVVALTALSIYGAKLQWQDELPTNIFVGGSVSRAPAKILRWAGNEDFVGAAPAPIFEDDSWSAPRTNPPAVALYTPAVADDVTGTAPAPAFEDDAWSPARLPLTPAAPPVFAESGEWCPPQVIDEEPWFAPLFRVPLAFYAPAHVDEAVSGAPPPPAFEDDSWLPRVAIANPAVAIATQPATDYGTEWCPPQLFEENEWSAPYVVATRVTWLPPVDQDYVPAPGAFAPEEQDWSVPQPLSATVNGIVWATDEEIVPQPVVGATGGGISKAPAKILRWPVGDEVVSAPAVALEESEWRPPAPSAYVPVCFTPAQQDDAALNFALDEEPWQRFAWLTPAPVITLYDDEGDIAVSALAVPNDEPWLRFTWIVAPPVVTLFDDEGDVAVTTPPLTPDDDGWTPAPNFAVPARIQPVWRDQDEWVPPTYPDDADAAYAPPTRVPPPSLRNPWVEDDFVPPPPAPAFDDDVPSLRMRAAPLALPVPWWDDYFVPPAFRPEEDYWLTFFSVRVPPFLRIWTDQDERPSPIPPLADHGHGRPAGIGAQTGTRFNQQTGGRFAEKMATRNNTQSGQRNTTPGSGRRNGPRRN